MVRLTTVYVAVLQTFMVHFVAMGSDLSELYRYIMAGYEPNVRPALNHTEPVNVTFGFSLTQIIDVDERNQIMTTNAWINQNWIDHNLKWDPADFSNISVIHIPHERIWRPDVVLYNNADSHYSTAIMSTDVFVTSDGNVTWLSAGIFKSSCQMDVRYYPFDDQTCLMKYASWAYDGTKLDLLIVSEEGDASNYMASTEWSLSWIRAEKNYNNFSCCPEPFPDVVVHIRIRRRPMFYVFNLILPCVLITGVALLGFYMPSESGEKVTLGITTLLSMTVFLMLVAESMPPTSDTLPLIGMYYGVTICLVSFATAMTVFTLNIHHKGLRGHPVPRLAKLVVFGYLAPFLGLTVNEWPPTTPLLREPSLIEERGPVGAELSWKDRQIEEEMEVGEREGEGSGLLKLSNGGSFSVLSPETAFTGSGLPCSTGNVVSEFEFHFYRLLHKMNETIEKNERRLQEQDRRESIKLEWQQVALVLDRFLLLVFLVSTTAVSLLIIYQRQLNIG